MGLRPKFSKHPKSPSSVVDPPVFNHKQDDLMLKGHKSVAPAEKQRQTPTNGGYHRENSGSSGGSGSGSDGRGGGRERHPSSSDRDRDRDRDRENRSLGGNQSVGSNHSSQAIWVANANANAKHEHQRLRHDSSGSYDSMGAEESSYYEEYSVEDEYDEEEMFEDSLPPRAITIRFDEYDEMQTILHINDYTNGEISKAWYKREDYDKMVTLARKTAEKVEERRKDISKMDAKRSRKIESRGLEAWTTFGAAKVRLLKESAVEAVWNEQSRQWDLGIHDPERLRDAYIKISKGAQAAAEDRGFSDFLIAKRIREIEAEEAEKKRRRKLLGKSKALARKGIKKTAGGVVKTAKLGVKTTKLTGKVALKTGKVATKTAIATATLDRKMLKETIIPERRKKSFKPETMRQHSASHNMEHSDHGTKQTEDDDGTYLSTWLRTCASLHFFYEKNDTPLTHRIVCFVSFCNQKYIHRRKSIECRIGCVICRICKRWKEEEIEVETSRCCPHPRNTQNIPRRQTTKNVGKTSIQIDATIMGTRIVCGKVLNMDTYLSSRSIIHASLSMITSYSYIFGGIIALVWKMSFYRIQFSFLYVSS